MIAGVIGLILSLAGLVGLWVAKPILTTTINTTVDTLISSVATSQKTLDITYDALGATIGSVDALSDMLDSTAVTVEDTQPIIIQVNDLMGETLPKTIETATGSLDAAEDAAQSLESAIKSFEVLQSVLGATPFLSAVLPPAQEPYNPETSLADSLSDLSDSMQDMPEAFKDMSTSLGKADNNLELVKDSMTLMSENVTLISTSLSQYQTMISQSKASTDSLNAMLTGFQSKMPNSLNIASIVLVLFFLWLLAAQVVIFSQGYELYHGTASEMASSEPDTDQSSPVRSETKPESEPDRNHEKSDSEEQTKIESETMNTESDESGK